VETRDIFVYIFMKIILLYKWTDKNRLDIIEIDNINANIMISLGIAIIYNDYIYKYLKEKEAYEFSGQTKASS